MNLPRLLIIGSGGHANSCIDVIEQGRKFKIAGIIDNKKMIGETILNYKIIGSDDDLPMLRQDFDYAFVAIGQIKFFDTKLALFTILQKLNFKLPYFISPYAYFSPHAQIGQGSIVMHGAIINSRVVIGCNTIINSNALIEHDTIVDDHCHISTASVLNGGVRVHSRSFVGSGSVVIENISIGNNCFIGASSLVKSDLADGEKHVDR